MDTTTDSVIRGEKKVLPAFFKNQSYGKLPIYVHYSDVSKKLS
ncbi:hypothetical protein [Flavobacterium caseinilyticum]|nr:hypothetical protein [Flavobacterium caseinilyticum]